jgi:hypothetical protein
VLVVLQRVFGRLVVLLEVGVGRQALEDALARVLLVLNVLVVCMVRSGLVLLQRPEAWGVCLQLSDMPPPLRHGVHARTTKGFNSDCWVGTEVKPRGTAKSRTGPCATHA